MEELRQNVWKQILNLFQWWDYSEISSIQNAILDDVCKDVVETSDSPNYNDSDIRISIKRTIVNRLGLKGSSEDFDVSRFGDDTLTQISNMYFTDAQRMILDYALKLEEQGFSDEEYYDLAFYFARQNGLNI
jgi:hypothetical protein